MRLELPQIAWAGVSPWSSVDWPQKMVATLFTQGCPWSCDYCHNSHLQDFSRVNPMLHQKIAEFLHKRQGLLDGIVISGGEPLYHSAIPEFMQMMGQMGYGVGLHTTGMYSERFAEALPFCDWVGFDIKAKFDDYSKVVGVSAKKEKGEKIRKSLELLLSSGVDYECRTTLDLRWMDEEYLMQFVSEISAFGVRKFVIQLPRDSKNRSLNFRASDHFLKYCQSQIAQFTIR